MLKKMLKNIWTLFILAGMLFLSCFDVAFSQTKKTTSTKSNARKAGTTSSKTNTAARKTSTATKTRANETSARKRSSATPTKATKKVTLSDAGTKIKVEQQACRDAYVSCMDAQIKDIIDKYTYLYDDEAVQAYLDTGEPFRCLFYDIDNKNLPQNMQVVDSCRATLNEATINSFEFAQKDMDSLVTQYSAYIKNPTCSDAGEASLPVNSTAKTGICSNCNTYKTLNSFLSSHSTVNTAWKNYQSLCKEKYLVNANKDIKETDKTSAEYKKFVNENCLARDVNDLYFSYNYYCDLRSSTLKNAIGVKTNYCKLSSEEDNTDGLTGEAKVRAEIANVFGTTSSSEYYKEALNRLDSGELKMVNFTDSNLYKLKIEGLGLETVKTYDISSLLNTSTKCDTGYKYNASIAACQKYNSSTGTYQDAGLSMATFVAATSTTSGSCSLSEDVFDELTKKCARCSTSSVWNADIRRCQDKNKVSDKIVKKAEQEEEKDARSIYTDLGINRDSSLFSINVVPPLGSGLVFPSALFNKATTYCFDGSTKITTNVSAALKAKYAEFNKNKNTLAACKEEYKDDLERYYLAGYWPKEDVEPSANGTYNTNTDYEERDFMSSKRSCDMYEQNLISVRNNNYAKFDTQIKNYLEVTIETLIKNKVKDTTAIANVATALQKDDAQRTLNDIQAQSDRETSRLESKLEMLEKESEFQTKQHELGQAYIASQKKLKESISKNFKTPMLTACQQLGESSIKKWRATDSSAKILAQFIADMTLKVSSTGDIVKPGDSKYAGLDPSMYPEIACFDIDGFYDSAVYDVINKQLATFMESKTVKENVLKEHTSGSSKSDAISMTSGFVKIEVAGGGGGGGGGGRDGNNKDHPGGRGGNGDLQIKYMIVDSELNLPYSFTIGRGGNGTDHGDKCSGSTKTDKDYGEKGGTTTFTFFASTVSAEGGNGGGKTYCIGDNSGANDGYNLAQDEHAGNGLGGRGGSAGHGPSNAGGDGGNGWVKFKAITF